MTFSILLYYLGIRYTRRVSQEMQLTIDGVDIHPWASLPTSMPFFQTIICFLFIIKQKYNKFFV